VDNTVRICSKVIPALQRYGGPTMSHYSTLALPLALWYAAKHLKLSCVIQMASSPEFVRAIGSMRKLILIVVKAHAASIAASGGIPEK
jgi:hypothetical protein